MNLPNKLTVLRVALVPVFIALLMITAVPFRFLLACIVFVAASLTDMLDGKIARKYNLITDFGKLMDPLADKLLVTSAVVMYIYLGLASPIAVLIILARDMLINAIRMLAASKGHTLAAGMFGKVKTVTQMTGIIAVMLMCQLGELGVNINTILISNIIMWVISAITLASGIDYVIKYRKYINM